MDIRFQVSKPANIFHVVESLSAWSMHTDPRIKKWYEALYGISERDKTLLEQYSCLRQKYGWKTLDSDFVVPASYEKALANARKRLTPSEFGVLNSVMKHFSENAGLMYRDSRQKLKTRKTNLEWEIPKHDTTGLFKDAASFYEACNCPGRVTVHLLLNVCDVHAEGGANVEPEEHVTLEPHYLGKEKPDYILWDIGTSAHEITHLIERHADPAKMLQYLSMTGNKGIQSFEENILREAIADTLLPQGVLSVKYGLSREPGVLAGKDIQITPYSRDRTAYYYELRRKLAAHLYGQTLQALKAGRSVFEGDYLERAADTLTRLKPK